VESTAGKKEAADLAAASLGRKVPLLPATASDTNAYSRRLDAKHRTPVIAMTAAPIVSVILTVSVTLALDDHPSRSAFAPAATVPVAHHAHVLHAVIDACCHRVKGRRACAADE
jgi:hypothetical protein